MSCYCCFRARSSIRWQCDAPPYIYVHKCSLLVVSGGTVGRNFQLPSCKAHRNAAECIAVNRLQAMGLMILASIPGRGNRGVTSTRLYVLPKLVLCGAAPPNTFLVIILFIDYGLFNRTVGTSGPLPAVPCLSCTTTTPSGCTEPGAFCPGAVWVGLSEEYAASILRDFAEQLHKTTINFVCLSIRPSVCPSACPCLITLLALNTFL